MQTQPVSNRSVFLPLTKIKPLFRSKNGKKLVVEVDVESIKLLNKPQTVDELVAEARLEYASGAMKGFDNPDDLLDFLKS